MFYFTKIAPLFSFVVTFVAMSTTSFSIENSPENLPHGMVHLGGVDGKNFFVDTSSNRNWTAARQFCIDANMHLATVTSQSQATLLERAYNNATFSGVYWTGGRDAQNLSRMVWDYNNQTVNNGSSLTEYRPASVTTCLSYWSKNSTRKDKFVFYTCGNVIGVLCEIIN